MVFEAVGSRAPWRDNICAKVIWHCCGSSSGMVEGTLKYGLYWPGEDEHGNY